MSAEPNLSDWVERTMTLDAIDPAVRAIDDNPGWRLLGVGMGSGGQTTLTYGWPWPGSRTPEPEEEVESQEDRLARCHGDNPDECPIIAHRSPARAAAFYGRSVPDPEPEEETPRVVDLMRALEASLSAVKAGRQDGVS